MKRYNSLTLCALLGAALAFGGCDDDDDDDAAGGAGGQVGGSGGAVGGAGGEAGGAGGEIGGAGGEAGGAGGEAIDLSSANAIEAYLDGKVLLMDGDNLPTDPNGFNENINFGQATQCYNSTEMVFSGGIFQVTSELGTLNDAPEQGDVGTCDHDTISNTLMFSSTGHSFANVEGNGDCFDFNITYAGFGQEGRGRITESGAVLELELFFPGSATGHRCADGAVGSGTVMLNEVAFEGDAVQVYEISEQ